MHVGFGGGVSKCPDYSGNTAVSQRDCWLGAGKGRMEVGFAHSRVFPISWYKLINHKFKGYGLKRLPFLERKYKIRIKLLGLKNDGFPSN